LSKTIQQRSKLNILSEFRHIFIGTVEKPFMSGISQGGFLTFRPTTVQKEIFDFE
jgi:hypothetical protein